MNKTIGSFCTDAIIFILGAMCFAYDIQNETMSLVISFGLALSLSVLRTFGRVNDESN